jgi:hypothetical protein
VVALLAQRPNAALLVMPAREISQPSKWGAHARGCLLHPSPLRSRLSHGAFKYYYARGGFHTEHPQKSHLLRKAVPDVPACDGMAPLVTTGSLVRRNPFKKSTTIWDP